MLTFRIQKISSRLYHDQKGWPLFLKKLRFFQICKMGLKTEWKTLFFGEVAGGTDFSGPIRKSGKRNSKTVVVWAKDIYSVRDLLVYPQEKYDEKRHPFGRCLIQGLGAQSKPCLCRWNECTTLQLCLSSRLVFRSDSDTNRENPKKERTRAAGVQFGAAHRWQSQGIQQQFVRFVVLELTVSLLDCFLWKISGFWSKREPRWESHNLSWS